MIALAFLNAPREAIAGTVIAVQVSLANTDGFELSGLGTHPARLSYRWDGDVNEPLRSPIWRPCEPMNHGVYWIDVAIPELLGTRTLLPAIVLEGLRWLEEAVATPVRIEVVAARDRQPDSIAPFEERQRSQNGEDGIVRELLLRIGTSERFVVEIGAGDGSENNSALWLDRYGWSGLLIEGDSDNARTLGNRYRDNPGVHIVNRYVDVESLIDVFRVANVPRNFDLLSIDTDGNDYWYWKTVAEWQPAIVLIEYNALRGPAQDWVMPYDPDHRWNDDDYFGASLVAFERLGASLGYALIGAESCGVNAFFLRDDLLEKSRFRRVEAAAAFRPLRSAAMRPPTPANERT